MRKRKHCIVVYLISLLKNRIYLFGCVFCCLCQRCAQVKTYLWNYEKKSLTTIIMDESYSLLLLVFFFCYFFHIFVFVFHANSRKKASWKYVIWIYRIVISYIVWVCANKSHTVWTLKIEKKNIRNKTIKMFIFYTAHQKNQTDDRCFVQWFGVRIVIGIDDISWRYGNVVGECFLCVCVCFIGVFCVIWK